MPAHLKHGHAMTGRKKATYYYSLWIRIKQCCYCHNFQAYHNYGARGIRVHEPWKISFIEFLQDLVTEIGERPSLKHSLDRKDNDGHYEPGNLKWSTVSEQGRNRRGNRIVTAFGQTRTITEWSEISGISWYTIGRRDKAGWTKERAVSEPARNYRKEQWGVVDGRNGSVQ